jgi:hypothetical protein
MDFQLKTFNFKMVVNSIYVFQYHLLEKDLTKTSTNNPSFEIYM